jgi:Domain of unknown function (DUF222)
MIEDQVRALVAGMSAAETRTLAEQVDDIAALDRTIAMLQAARSERMVAFVESRRRKDRARGSSVDDAGRGASTELAMACRVSTWTVDNQLGFATILVDDFPQLLQACLDGQVSQAAAKNIVTVCDPLTSDQRRQVDAELTLLALEQTPGEIKKTAIRKVAAIDSDAAERKAALARARKHVRAILHGDGTGTLSALLPAEQAVAAWQALDHTARGMRADGDDRSINQLMGDLLVERLTGQTKATDLNLEVGLVVSASSLLGEDDQPGKLVGHHGGDYGTLPAGLIRQLATTGHAWWRRLVCDPLDGTLVAMDTKKRRFTGPLRKFITLRDGTSRRPYSSAPVYDLDHIRPHADGGPTTAANGQGLSKRDHHLRDLPDWTVTGDANDTTTWTTPTGHTYHSRPPPILGHGNTRKPRRRRQSRQRSQSRLLNIEIIYPGHDLHGRRE